MNIGDRIKQAREVRGIKRPALARLLDMPYATLAGIENGDQDSSTRLHAIAKVLSVRVEWLESGKGCMDMDGAEPAPGGVSQSVRFDLRMIANAAWAMGEAYAAKGRVFRLEEDQERFMQVYRLCLELADMTTPGNTAKLMAFVQGLTESLGVEGEGRGNSEPPSGVHQSEVARGIRNKG